MSGQKREHENTLPTDLQEVLARRPYLNRYLNKLSEDNISTPAWFLTLDKKLNKDEVNLIYPVSEEVFIHVFRQKSMERARYIIIEPTTGQDLTQIMNTLENIFAYKLNDEHIYGNIEEKKAALKKLVDSTLKVDNTLNDVAYRISKGKNPTLLVNQKTKELLEYLLVRDKIGVGPLEPMIKDPYIEDISFNGVGPVFVEHKVFGSCVSSLR